MSASNHASVLSIGDQAPDFHLPSDDGKQVALSDYVGKRVVLYFYPKDNTPGCTLEAKDFAHHYDFFQKHSIILFGISPDSISKHQRFKKCFSLPFPLLADEGALVAKAYSVWVEKKMFGKSYMGIDRSTFLIDPSGKIEHVWRPVRIKGHAEAVIAECESKS